MGTLLIAWQWLSSKATVIGLTIVAVSIVSWRVVTSLVASGEAKERLKQAEQAVNNTKKEAQINAQIDRMSDADIRGSMLDQWKRS